MGASGGSSLPSPDSIRGLTLQSIIFVKTLFAKEMDARVKPGQARS